MNRFRLMLAVTFIFWARATLQAQTPADFARQERQRKAALQSKTVFTNESIQSATGIVVTTTAGTSVTGAAAADVQPSAKGPVDNKGRDEQYWRTYFDKARQEVRRAQDKIQLLEQKGKDLTSQLLREGVYAREVEIRSEITKTKTEQVAARQHLARSEQGLRDLEEEHRRSGGLPGRARP